MPRITSLYLKPNAQGSAEISIRIDGKTSILFTVATREDALLILRHLCGAPAPGCFSEPIDDALRDSARFGGEISIAESGALSIVARTVGP